MDWAVSAKSPWERYGAVYRDSGLLMFGAWTQQTAPAHDLRRVHRMAVSCVTRGTSAFENRQSQVATSWAQEVGEGRSSVVGECQQRPLQLADATHAWHRCVLARSLKWVVLTKRVMLL